MSLLRKCDRGAGLRPAGGAEELSVVVPVYNESGSIEELYGRLTAVLKGTGARYEIIFVDDGSTDGSAGILKSLAESDSRAKVIGFARNFGQTAALMAGIEIASGGVIVTLDADLQNLPEDIPLLLKKLDEGFDIVCGWRKNRDDLYLLRVLPSRLANLLIARLFGLKIHDFGCTLKAFRGSFIKTIALYGEMHRLIPVVVAHEGGRIAELPVRHAARRQGVSKYGISRVFRVLLDLFLLKFMVGYSTSPIHYFGYLSLGIMAAGVAVGGATLYQRYIEHLPGINLIPLILLTMFLLLMGLMTLLFGIIADIGIRIYFSMQQYPIYRIRQSFNLNLAGSADDRISKE